MANGWCDGWKRPHFRGIEIAEKNVYVMPLMPYISIWVSLFFLFLFVICRIKAEKKEEELFRQL